MIRSKLIIVPIFRREVNKMRLLPPSLKSIESQLNKSLSASRKGFDKLTKFQKRTSNKAISLLSGNFKSLSKYMGFKRYSAADQFFFKFDDLPFMGKEYWFLHFTDFNTKKQLVITFGRAASGMDINKLRVRGKKNASGLECAAVAWLFDGKRKQVLFNTKEMLSLEKNHNEFSLRFDSTNHYFSFAGKYPSYRLHLEKNGAAISLKILRSKKGKPYEILNSFSPTIGIGLVNLYFDFKGEMLGEKFEGKCYVQKVILTSPFLPWNWGRLYFENNSIFEFFTIYTPLIPGKFKLFSQAHYFDYERNKTYYFKQANVRKSSKNNYWQISGKEYSILSKCYSSHPFSFKGIGEFNYLEYFAETANCTINGKPRGKAVGILEDAFGFVI